MEDSTSKAAAGLVLQTLFGSKNPIKEYKIGLPVMQGELVARIVGESDKGSWGYFNDIKCPSIILIATPHGTVIETGVAYLSKITDDGMKKLLDYETDVLNKGGVLYGGRINDQLEKIKLEFKKGDTFFLADYETNTILKRLVLDVIDGRIYWNYRDNVVQQSIPEWFNGRHTLKEAEVDFEMQKDARIREYENRIKKIEVKLNKTKSKIPVLTTLIGTYKELETIGKS